MSPQDLGNPLSSLYSIQGGQAHIYERGLVVDGIGGEVALSFAFPMIGRPSIVTGDPAVSPSSEFKAFSFSPGNWQVEQLTPLAQKAIEGRLALLPTGRSEGHVPLILGSAAQPEQFLPGYSLSVKAPGLQERQLYDVAVLTNAGAWQVIAPHAVYHRRQWTDFGIAHVTDIHVARRIDSFRQILKQAGRTEAAERLINWNDRFRGFIKFANYLHSIGVLDIILAIGDLYDFIYENDDNRNEGSNASFFRELLLGQAPGPDFPEVEELVVPIFVTAGNHDYRKFPYKLIFDLNDAQLLNFDLKRVRQYSGYNIEGHDAAILTLGKEFPEFFEDTLLGTSIDESARMVEVDRDLKAYKTFLADRLSYQVQLGDHRIVMLDSGPDTGMVTGIVDYILGISKINKFSEDEQSFLDSGPNSEGISDGELNLVAETLAEAPDEGLVIVGVHAPLFNIWGDLYPYFLRETQRPALNHLVYPFLVNFVPLKGDRADVEARYPRWFRSKHDDRSGAPSFVKRGGNNDFFDSNVSRGKEHELTLLLTGVGARRPADVILSGHVHSHKEFRTKYNHQLGELIYYMDFYTQNPKGYYPTRFPQSWDQDAGLNLAKVTTDVTYIEIFPGAASDATPSLMPEKRKYKYQLQIPPYPNPLASATNSRDWWEQHRPLFLQTGALGPLDNSSFTFSGFRVLALENNVIENVYFISIADLEAHQYRRNWYHVIRDYPLKHPSPACAADAKGNLHVCAIDQAGGLWHTMRMTDGTWQTGFADVQKETSSIGPTRHIACAADPAGNLHVCAIDQSGGLWHTIRMADGTWQPGFADIQKETSSIGPTQHIACAADPKGNLHVCAIDQSGGLWHTIRMADGTWQPGFGDVQKETSAIGPIRHIACAADPKGNLHVCAIDQSGGLWHTIRMADGTWQPGFGDVQKETSAIGPTRHVACAADPKGNLHLCAIDGGGVLWHTMRMADGTWQPGFGDVQKETSAIGPTRRAACAADLKGNLHVCAIDQARGLWHTMRIADGTWPFGFGDVYAVSGPLP